jgi:formate dehydrogenase major subunit
MRAAAECGGSIPKLCATDSVKAFGSCRLCLVEIDGRAALPPAAPRRWPRHGRPHPDPAPQKLRRGVMELYISDHPLDCLTCSANNDCELQDQAAAVGLRDVRYGYDGANHLGQPNSTPPTPISISIPASASSARAACAPATKCRARWR